MVRAVRNPLFFFRQKTAYEMRISVWSSDVCSSDLILASTALPSATPAAETSALRPRAVAAYAATAGPTVMLGLPFSVYLRSEEHTSELQSLMRISYAVFCLKQQKDQTRVPTRKQHHTSKTNTRTLLKH